MAVIDGSDFVKRGSESVGVQRQWCSRLGKEENCQVGVFLLGVTPGGNALLDHQLYLPEQWAADAARRKKTRVPKEITFQTKPEIAAALPARSTVRFDWVTADEEFGRLRVWSVRHRHAGPQLWLLIRRSLEPVPEVVCHANAA